MRYKPYFNGYNGINRNIKLFNINRNIKRSESFLYNVLGLMYKKINYRSSRQEVLCKKGVFKSFTKFTGKHLRQSHLFNKVALALVFSREF